MERARPTSRAVFGKVHVLCNNAGVAAASATDEHSYEDWDYVMGGDVGGTVNGLVNFPPRIKAHGEGGHIVNTSSMAGMIPVPGFVGSYSTAKFAVRGMSDSLRLNLAKDGIGVSTLCPGLTRSRIMSTANPDGPAEPQEDALFNDMSGAMDPLELGEAVLRGVQRNDPYILPHGEFKEEVGEIFEEILAACFRTPGRARRPPRLRAPPPRDHRSGQGGQAGRA